MGGFGALFGALGGMGGGNFMSEMPPGMKIDENGNITIPEGDINIPNMPLDIEIDDDGNMHLPNGTVLNKDQFSPIEGPTEVSPISDEQLKDMIGEKKEGE
jgi:hypothetical protein